MSNGRLAIPNQINIDVQLHHGPTASPTAVQLNRPDGVVQHVFGGMTKLEQGAIAIAAAMCAVVPPPDNAYEVEPHEDRYMETIPKNAVAIAQRVLAECERIQQPPRVQS